MEPPKNLGDCPLIWLIRTFARCQFNSLISNSQILKPKKVLPKLPFQENQWIKIPLINFLWTNKDFPSNNKNSISCPSKYEKKNLLFSHKSQSCTFQCLNVKQLSTHTFSRYCKFFRFSHMYCSVRRKNILYASLFSLLLFFAKFICNMKEKKLNNKEITNKKLHKK